MIFARSTRIFLAVACALVLGLTAACGTNEPSTSTAGETAIEVRLVDLGLAGLSSRELVDALDALPVVERPKDLMASVRSNEVILTDLAENETVIDLPEDFFYVSFAPYVDETHPCTFHSLTTCLGEMRNSPIEVKVTNVDSGDVVFEESATTFDNGFFGLWLPRDSNFALNVEADGRSAEVKIDSNESAATCVTDVKLT